MTKKIGRFEIRGELGRGAQSTVYLGFDPQLQREIAIKTVHFSKPDLAKNKVLLDEARTVSKLRHPNIVPIFEVGEEAGDLYLVFEYVPGKNLGEFLQQSGALSAIQALNFFRPILDAVSHAHAHGVIHRDLKPSNILIDEDNTARVMDFGIAARVDAPNNNTDEYSGTPAYMAPEYIDKREFNERTDVFSAGLVLYEMLFGRPAYEGKDIFQLMNQIANQDLVLPEITTVDDHLRGILQKSVSRDPLVRFQTTGQFLEAIDNYLDPEDAVGSISEGKQSTLDFLLRRMRHKTDFPALSESVSAINKIANSETESINKLSNTILKDFALTNKILRLVNSAYFRPAGGGNISTVSRAVIVLGFEAVRNIAITVLLFEHLQNKNNANQLKEDFLRANLAGLLAKEICATAKMHDLEQSFICAMFHNLGRLLSQFYFADESDEIRRVVAQKSCSEDVAARQVLGISFEDMGIAIARQWGFPLVISGTMRKLPAGKVRKAVSQEDRLRVLSVFSNELCEVIAQATPEARDREMQKTMLRFAEAISLDAKAVKETVMRSVVEAAEFARIIHLNVQQTTFGKQMLQFAHLKDLGGNEGASDDPLHDALLQENESPDSFADGVIDLVDAQSILTAGIQDISNTLLDDFKLNDILRMILETMYRAMGFKRVVLCIRDPKAGCMQGRFGFGSDANEVAKAFRMPLSFTPDVFHVAMSKGVDLMISDVNDPKIAERIPAWYKNAAHANSFVLFPLNIKGNPVALIYADSDMVGGLSIPEKELSLLRTLRNQAILAIKQGG
jgi:serine/threonine protein kinase